MCVFVVWCGVCVEVGGEVGGSRHPHPRVLCLWKDPYGVGTKCREVDKGSSIGYKYIY